MNILDGIKVLDLTNVLSGPFAALHLAWLGAEVIKIENPVGGDLARNLGCVADYNQKLMGTSFLAQNANKKSMTLNLKESKAKEIFLKLVDKADIIVEKIFQQTVFSWGSRTLSDENESREKYLIAIRKADKGDFELLLKFARS